jgi:hypothetical protein
MFRIGDKSMSHVEAVTPADKKVELQEIGLQEAELRLEEALDWRLARVGSELDATYVVAQSRWKAAEERLSLADAARQASDEAARWAARVEEDAGQVTALIDQGRWQDAKDLFDSSLEFDYLRATYEEASANEAFEQLRDRCQAARAEEEQAEVLFMAAAHPACGFGSEKIEAMGDRLGLARDRVDAAEHSSQQAGFAAVMAASHAAAAAMSRSRSVKELVLSKPACQIAALEEMAVTSEDRRSSNVESPILP